MQAVIFKTTCLKKLHLVFLQHKALESQVPKLCLIQISGYASVHAELRGLENCSE